VPAAGGVGGGGCEAGVRVRGHGLRGAVVARAGGGGAGAGARESAGGGAAGGAGGGGELCGRGVREAAGRRD
jgi:hypothetical protein